MIGLSASQLDPSSEHPLYRQLYEQIRSAIRMGSVRNGDRLPPTRELAAELGLNRTTVSAAYSLLEEEGLIRGEVGRGSFVQYEGEFTAAPDTGIVSFASSRPAEDHFPIEEFRATSQEVIQSSQVGSILQLGSPSGYGPLRHHLLEQARSEGSAGPEDDILITSGCQQALDMLQRAFIGPADAVLLEDPVYHGLKNVFSRVGARLVGVPVREDGLDLDYLGRTILTEHPRMVVVTPEFQNPTGATIPLEQRERLARMVEQSGALLVENCIYKELRYEGDPIRTVKSMAGGTLQLGSFSKVAFPGLRVGWIIGPRPLIARLTETKQWCDLHSDQLSQAILLRFAESGRLEQHLKRVRTMGAARLHTALDACSRHLPAGTRFSRPRGGMSLWVRLPEPLDANELLPLAQRERVDYLPGKHFSISHYEPGSLRLSFGGLSPEQIESGLATLGKVINEEGKRLRTAVTFDAAPAMV